MTFLLLLRVASVGGWPTGRPRFGLKMVVVEGCWEVFVVGYEVLFGWEVVFEWEDPFKDGQ